MRDWLGPRDEVRRAPVWLLATTLLCVAVSNSLANFWFVPSGIWQPVLYASEGWIGPVLLGGLIGVVLQIALPLFWLGRFRPRDLGLRASGIIPALFGALAVWAMVQAVALTIALLDGTGLTLDPRWTLELHGFALGELLGQFGGNALVEEVVNRGFLVVQLLLLFQLKWPDRSRRATLAALVLAGVFFAVPHLPNRIYNGMYSDLQGVLTDQAVLTVWGVVFGWMYLRTGNLFLVIGIHALVNIPALLFMKPHSFGDFGLISAAAGVLLASLWPRLVARSEPAPPAPEAPAAPSAQIQRDM